MIDAPATPEAPAEVPASPIQVWRTTALIVFSLVLVVLLGVIVFSALGLANDGVGGCGGA